MFVFLWKTKCTVVHILYLCYFLKIDSFHFCINDIYHLCVLIFHITSFHGTRFFMCIIYFDHPLLKSIVFEPPTRKHHLGSYPWDGFLPIISNKNALKIYYVAIPYQSFCERSKQSNFTIYTYWNWIGWYVVIIHIH